MESKKAVSSLFKFKNDSFKKSRGGSSKLLDISCEKCGRHLCFYQKDGPGILKRMYLDRITNPPSGDKLICPNCLEVVGIRYVYKKENRLAFRLLTASVTKKIVKK